jgi:hypothetical protein
MIVREAHKDERREVAPQQCLLSVSRAGSFLPLATDDIFLTLNGGERLRGMDPVVPNLGAVNASQARPLNIRVPSMDDGQTEL